MTISIGLVDDDPLLLQLLSKSLQHEGMVIAWAVDATAAEELLAQPLPAVIAVDIHMPDISGFEFVRRVLHRHPGQPTMMLTSLEDSESLARALAIGAVGYLSKVDPPDRIAAGLRAAAAGLRSFSPSLPTLEAPSATVRPARASPLTARETEVLELMSQSLTNDQIARRLRISGDTVKRHVSSILGKVEVPDRLGAVMWGIRNQIIGWEQQTERPSRGTGRTSP